MEGPMIRVVPTIDCDMSWWVKMNVASVSLLVLQLKKCCLFHHIHRCGVVVVIVAKTVEGSWRTW